ncbi:hypothetical protein damhaus_24 [Escherichia phage damhaus]|uniref:Peptidase S74 domain-containing protein n=1 Tax=Escherichia phage damhaus TaxID=2696389 RepID=A0A6B9X499_9CAUD|nr:tail fiber protein [Escherichia phage damhaus]QHR69939.1 hypothetical protein damhaus_24 [Escherichia phage damhaus]
MAIYRTGQASMDAQGYITGYDTKWREQLTLIRPGATIVFLTQPLQIAVITEVINDTSIRAITTGGAVVTRSNYAILLHDSITVDGLAQDVAETLRYYQSKETEIADALEFFRDFDLEGLKDLVNQVKQGAESAKQSASAAKTSETNAVNARNDAEQFKNAAKASQDSARASQIASDASQAAAKTSETNAKSSEAAAKTSQAAAKTSETNAKASENAAMASKTSAAASATAAKTSETNSKASETNAKASETAANTSKTQAAQSAQSADASKTAAAVSATAAAVSATTAKNEADRAAELAKQLDATNMMRKDANLSDVVDVVQSKQNLSLDRFEQDSTETIVRCPDKNTYFSLKDRGVGWGVYDTDGWVALSVARGGTGALNAPEARKNLDVPGLNVSNTFVGSQLFKGSQDAVKIQRASDESSGGCWTVYLFADGQPGFRAGFYGPNYAIYSYRNNSELIKRCMSLTPDGNVSFGGEISGNGFRITGNNGASFYNDGGGGNNLSLKADGTVELNSKGGVGYIDSKGSVISLINGGRAYRLHNVKSAAKDAAMRLWGSADRPTVIEWGVPDGYFYYVQENKDGSRTMKMNGNIECTTLTQVSDGTLKDNIQKIENATESLRKINGYTYTLKSNGMPYAGVIAQEVMEALPEAISGGFNYEELPGPSTDGDRVLGEERYLAVDYSALTGLLVQVCRESDERISKLESEIEELKAIVSSLNNNL